MPVELWDEPGDGSADEPAEELLTSARDRASVDEQLTGVARRGLVFAGRHPGWVAGAVVLVLLGAALAVYLVRRPPPVSSTVAATFELSSTEGNQYVVQLSTPGEEIHPIGVVGPGLVDPTSTVPRVTADGPGLGTLGATIDCRDQTWWGATADDYAVQVTRTDPYGRTTTNDVPFTRSLEWWSNVRLACLTDYVGTEPIAATATPGKFSNFVDVHLELLNPGPHDLVVSTWATPGSGPVSWFAVDPQAWPANAQTSLEAPLLVSCTGGPPELPRVGGIRPRQPGVLLSVNTANDLTGSGRVVLAMPLRADAVDAINAELVAAC